MLLDPVVPQPSPANSTSPAISRGSLPALPTLAKRPLRRCRRGQTRLLVVGCGDVAQRIVAQLAQRVRVYAVVRSDTNVASLRAAGITPIRADLDQARSLHRLAGLAHWVWHTAPPSDQHPGDIRSQRLIAALAGAASLPCRLCYISTTGVYGDCAGQEIDETHQPQPESARGIRRVAAEKLMRQLALRQVKVSILRAPGIYAYDRLPIERLQRGTPALNAHEDSYSNHIHAQDLARASWLALARSRTGRVYNACDDSALKMGDWFERVADFAGLPHPQRISREQAEQTLSPMLWSFMRESRRIANQRLKRELRIALQFPTVDSVLGAPTLRNTKHTAQST